MFSSFLLALAAASSMTVGDRVNVSSVPPGMEKSEAGAWMRCLKERGGVEEGAMTIDTGKYVVLDRRRQ